MDDLIKKIVEGTIDDMVFRDKPKKRHVKRMGKDLGPLSGFPIEKFKNVLPPKNESGETEEEIQKLDSILVDSDFVDSADDVDNHFEKFLDSKDLEYPREEIKKYMSGVRAIILQLKYHYNRPRPGQVADAKGMNFDRESLKSASTPSYPSGHATQGRFISKLLSDMYPEYEDQLMKIGDDIAYSRNMAKVHYPSDSNFGKELGDELYDFISKTKLRESIKKVLNEDQAPIKIYNISGNLCNGYGDYENYYTNLNPLANNPNITTAPWLDGYYSTQTLTWGSVIWDNGNSIPQVGDYFWNLGIVWRIQHPQGAEDTGQTVPAGTPGGIQKANVGNGEFCSSHWTCNPIKPHLHCKKQAISSQPGASPNLVNSFGNKDACLHNCPDTTPPHIDRELDHGVATGVVDDPCYYDSLGNLVCPCYACVNGVVTLMPLFGAGQNNCGIHATYGQMYTDQNDPNFANCVPISPTNDIEIGKERETLTNEDIESLVNKKLAPLANLNLGDVSEEEEEIKEVKNKYGIDVAYSSRLNEKGSDKPPKKKRIKIKESTLERMITRLISESRLLLKIKTRR